MVGGRAAALLSVGVGVISISGWVIGIVRSATLTVCVGG